MSAGLLWVVVVGVVLRKELIDALRDRRSLLSALIYPLVGPALVGLAFTFFADMEREARDLEIPVVGREHGPELVEWIERSGARVVEAPADPARAVADGSVELVVVIPAAFGERLAHGKTVEVELIADGTRTDSAAAVRRAQGLLEAYGAQLASLRLLARGVDPELATPIVVRDREVASARQLSASIMDFLPMFVVLAAFIGGMHVAADSTAGERERGSLEPLLINPVPRSAIVAGKWLAAVAFGMASLVLTLGFCVLVLRLAPMDELGLDLALAPGQIAALALVTAPMAFFAAGLQLLVASFARSFKEAQTYLSLLIFVPMVPGFLASFRPLPTTAALLWVPALGQQILLTDILGGEPVAAASVAWVAVPGLALGLACVGLTARLLGRETVVFGRG